jgi:hypothetical protein
MKNVRHSAGNRGGRQSDSDWSATHGRWLLIGRLLLALLLLLAMPGHAQGVRAGLAKSLPTRALAVAGDTVWVIVNHIKADKRAQFERFCTELFWPGAAKLSAAEQRVFRQTRVLNATRPDADGSYAYLFIMDPVLRGASYDIPMYLNKMYGAEKAAAYDKLRQACLARRADQYRTVQTHF